MTDEGSVFVARERELARLNEALNAALAGQGQVCFVTGEAGSGKTALVTEFARRAEKAHPDLVVAMGNCNAQTGTGDAYLPFREILGLLTGNVEDKQTISSDNANRLRELLRWSGNALLEFGPDLIDVLVPGAGMIAKAATFVADQAGWLEKMEEFMERKGLRRAKDEATGISDTALEQSHLFEQYTNVLRALAAKRPLMLVVDDLQWADMASISLLFHLGRRIDESRILLVGTYRPAEVALGRAGERHPLDKVLAEFKRYCGDIWVDLARAAETEGRQFVDALLDTKPNRLGEGFRQALFQHTDGHPLFTVELLRDMKERGDLVQDEEGRWVEGPALDWGTLPARVEGVIEERIGRLEAELQETLTVASVEGEEFIAEVIARVRDIDERGLVRQLSRELDKRHRLVQAQGRQRVNRQRLSLYRFRHNLFQRYLYNSLDEVEREFVHEDVGNVLEELYGEQAYEIAPQLARHFLEAGDEERALPYVMEAGHQAQRAYANEEAIHHFRTALEVTEEITGDVSEEKITIHEHLGDVLVNIGRYDEALESYTAALDLLEGVASPGRVAALYRKAGIVHRLKGQYAVALERLNQAQEALEGAHSAEMSRICTCRATVLYRQGEATKALEWCQRGLELAQEVEEREELAHAYMLRGTIHGDLGNLNAAIEDCLESLGISQETDDLLQQAKAHNGLGANYYYKGDWERAVTHYQQSLEIRERVGDVTGMATVSNNLGEVYLDQGRFDEAAACFQRCLESWEAMGFQLGVALSYRNLGQVCIRREEWEAALEHLQTSLQMLEEMGLRDWLMAEVYRHLAEAHLGLGQWETAYGFAQRSLDIAVAQGIKLVEGSARRVLGQVYRSQGQWEEAEALLEESLRLSEELGLRYEAGQALWELALLYRDRARAEGSDHDRAKMAEALNRATAIFEELGAQWDLAHAMELKAN